MTLGMMNIFKNMKAKKLRITGLYMLRRPLGGSGYEKPQSGLRPLCGFSPPHFCGCWNASRSFIATAKTSYTAETLCAIPPKLVDNKQH
jgi:hypothetical protein